MKVFLSFFICFQMIFAPVAAMGDSLRPTFYKNPIFTSQFYDAKAFALAGHMVWETNAELRARATQKGLHYAQNTARPAKGFIGHVGQTMIILWAIHGIAIVKEEVDRAHLMGKEVSWEDIEVMFFETFGHMIDNPEIWMSILGATTVGGTLSVANSATNLSVTLQEAKQAMSQVLTSSTAKMHFRTLLTSGAMSLVTFMGWEAGMILWQDAMLYMGENAGDNEQIHEDLKLAREMSFFKLVRSLWSNKHLSEDEQRIYSKMKQNMYLILTNDHGKRWKWFYNTWRKRIATGDFVLLVSAMSVGAWAGGVAGAKIGAALGVAGGLPGMIVMGFFGLAAGVVAGALIVFIPSWVKQGITEFIRDMRINVAVSSLNHEKKRQMEYIRIFSGESRWLQFRQSLLMSSFQSILDKRKQWRDKYMNAWIERYHNSIITKQFATFDNSIGAMTLDPEFSVKLTEFIQNEGHEEVAGQGLQEFVLTNQDAINGLLDQVDLAEHREALDELDREMNEVFRNGEMFTDEHWERRKYLLANYNRARQIEKNRKTIERANRQIDDSVHALYNFYSQDAKDLAEYYISQTWESEHGGQLPGEMDAQVRREIDRLTWMHQNILHILLGFHPEMNEQLHEQERLTRDQLVRTIGPSRALLNLYFEFGYYEDEVLEMIQSSLAETASASSSDASDEAS